MNIGAGCSTFAQRHPVPIDQLYRAQILPDVSAVRAWAGTFNEQFEADLIESVKLENHFTRYEHSLTCINENLNK